MARISTCLLCIALIAACTCGARTECTGPYKIAFLTSVHDDPGCKQLSTKGLMLYEAATYIADAHNDKSKGNKIEIISQDTCGSVLGSIKAAMKSMVTANVNCIQPPNFLGIIGPDSITNAEAVHKVTSLLKVPLVVKKANNVPYMHYLTKESDTYLVKGTVKLLEALKWKSFTLVIDSEDDDDDDDAKNLARKLTIEASQKKMCVMLYDDDNDYSSQIVHIGKPSNSFVSEQNNASIVIISEGNLKGYLNQVESSSNVILLEDSRKDLNELKGAVMKSKLWAENKVVPQFDAEELRDIRWLETAIHSYVEAMDTICKHKKCKGTINAADWNTELSNTLQHRNVLERSASSNLELSVKMKGGNVLEMGTVVVKKSVAKLFWKDKPLPDSDEDLDDDDDDEDDAIPDKFKKLISKDKSAGKGCTRNIPKVRVRGDDDDDDDDDDENPEMFEIDESDWWTMVMSVSAVGIAMFFVGIVAVHIVISNMRHSKPKSSGSRLERDGSFRRSDRFTTKTAPTPPQRPPRPPPQREDSIRDSISEKSV